MNIYKVYCGDEENYIALPIVDAEDINIIGNTIAKMVTILKDVPEEETDAAFIKTLKRKNTTIQKMDNGGSIRYCVMNDATIVFDVDIYCISKRMMQYVYYVKTFERELLTI